ncbi:cytochrome P450 [Microcoleus sp. FACHB-SPT15]|uniref:cytochrome P450 n=1 Tax=Microcoleus sp. FACHB-SPT15 TaxID=2692830 RepID=UPI001785A7C2|nr:cytochrome P450 [Microcoleus sp. FACHB-SPT15]MBD1808522.1 cytochrome P450 [Microcoleus sp. FACHB-SPT15]
MLKETVKYDLLSPSFYAAPDATLHRMRAEDPVYWHPKLEAWILTRYDDIQCVIRNPRFSVDRGGQIGRGGSAQVQDKLDFCNHFFAQWMVFSDPPRHTHLRTLVAKAFTPHLADSLQPAIARLADELISAVRGVGRMEVIHDFTSPLPSLVTAQMLGIPREHIPDLKRWSRDMFGLFGAGKATDEIVEATYQSLVACREYFEAQIAQRRKNPSNDLIGKLIAVEEQGSKLSEQELTGACITLMAGAYETTTYLISNGLLALLRHPAQLQKLRENPTLIDSAVEEFLRYEGPALSVVRRAIEDTFIGGRCLRSGQKIYCMLHAGNHDPARFPEPERLDIGRKDNRHLGLGLGIHFCLGAVLTRLETKIAINTIVQRLPELHLDTDELTWMPSLAMRGLQALPVAF